MDPKDQALASARLLTELVNGTGSDQLDMQTPCSDWKVRDLIGHVIGGGHMFAAGLTAKEPAVDFTTDLVGDDHRSSFQGAIDAFSSAVAAAEDMDSPCDLPFGKMPAGVALQMAAGDLLVHCWDLATTTEQTFDPPADLLDASFGFFKGIVNDDMRNGGMFGPEVTASSGRNP